MPFLANIFNIFSWWASWSLQDGFGYCTINFSVRQPNLPVLRTT